MASDDHETSLSPEARKALKDGLEAADDSKLVTWEPDTVDEHDARILEFKRQGFVEEDARFKARIAMLDEEIAQAAKARELVFGRLVDFIEIGGSSHTDVLNCLHDLLDTEAKADPEAPWVAKLRDVESKL